MAVRSVSYSISMCSNDSDVADTACYGNRRPIETAALNVLMYTGMIKALD